MEIPTGESGQALADQSGGEPFAVTGTCIHSDIQTPFSSFSIFPTPHNLPLSVNLQLEGEQLQTLSVSCALGASVESVRERVCGEWGLEHTATSLSFNGGSQLRLLLLNFHSVILLPFLKLLPHSMSHEKQENL